MIYKRYDKWTILAILYHIPKYSPNAVRLIGDIWILDQKASRDKYITKHKLTDLNICTIK